MREQVKQLWKRCFNDSEEFTEMYFSLRYNDEVNIALQSDGEVIAALQMLPYPMTFEGTTLSTAYVSGACTHPDYRNRGMMRELLAQAFARMRQNGIALSTLIPAEPWLFDYYAASGYAPVFLNASVPFRACPPISNDAYVLEETREYRQDIYDYLDRKLKERPCCILHTETDFRVILADLRLGGGTLYILRHNEKGNASNPITALAIAYPDGNGSYLLGELLADTPETGNLIQQYICQDLHIPSLQAITPATPDAPSNRLGMARIINAPYVLQRYATAHPEVSTTLELTDPQVSTNEGYYNLHNGTCTISAKRLPGNHLALTIGELTAKLLAPLHPYMSLMLN